MGSRSLQKKWEPKNPKANIQGESIGKRGKEPKKKMGVYRPPWEMEGEKIKKGKKNDEE